MNLDHRALRSRQHQDRLHLFSSSADDELRWGKAAVFCFHQGSPFVSISPDQQHSLIQTNPLRPSHPSHSLLLYLVFIFLSQSITTEAAYLMLGSSGHSPKHISVCQNGAAPPAEFVLAVDSAAADEEAFSSVLHLAWATTALVFYISHQNLVAGSWTFWGSERSFYRSAYLYLTFCTDKMFISIKTKMTSCRLPKSDGNILKYSTVY